MDELIQAAWHLLERDYDNIDIYFGTVFWVSVDIGGEKRLLIHPVVLTDTPESIKASIDEDYEMYQREAGLADREYEHPSVTQGRAFDPITCY